MLDDYILGHRLDSATDLRDGRCFVRLLDGIETFYFRPQQLQHSAGWSLVKSPHVGPNYWTGGSAATPCNIHLLYLQNDNSKVHQFLTCYLLFPFLLWEFMGWLTLQLPKPLSFQVCSCLINGVCAPFETLETLTIFPLPATPNYVEQFLPDCYIFVDYISLCINRYSYTHTVT